MAGCMGSICGPGNKQVGLKRLGVLLIDSTASYTSLSDWLDG